MDETTAYCIVGSIGIGGYFIMMVMLVVFGSPNGNEDKLLLANELVNVKADELSKLVDEQGFFVRMDKLTTKDPWMHELGVSYSKPKNNIQELEVRSAGPDGQFGNEDDLATRRWLPVVTDQ